MSDQMSGRLMWRVDPDGQVGQICAVCVEWIRLEDLVLDPAGGLRWDICVPCSPQAGLSADGTRVSSDSTGMSASPHPGGDGEERKSPA